MVGVKSFWGGKGRRAGFAHDIDHIYSLRVVFANDMGLKKSRLEIDFAI